MVVGAGIDRRRSYRLDDLAPWRVRTVPGRRDATGATFLSTAFTGRPDARARRLSCRASPDSQSRSGAGAPQPCLGRARSTGAADRRLGARVAGSLRLGVLSTHP